MAYETGGWFKRFQDTEGFDSDYASNHAIWCPEADDVIRDPDVEAAGFYANDDEEDKFRLKKGLVFVLDSSAYTDEEYLEESEKTDPQVCDDTFCIFFETEWSFRCGGQDGVIIDLNKSKIIKIINRR